MWTEEQEEIFASEGNLKINAVAGSGKTTTLSFTDTEEIKT